MHCWPWASVRGGYTLPPPSPKESAKYRNLEGNFSCFLLSFVTRIEILVVILLFSRIISVKKVTHVKCSHWILSFLTFYNFCYLYLGPFGVSVLPQVHNIVMLVCLREYTKQCCDWSSNLKFPLCKILVTEHHCSKSHETYMVPILHNATYCVFQGL